MVVKALISIVAMAIVIIIADSSRTEGKRGGWRSPHVNLTTGTLVIFCKAHCEMVHIMSLILYNVHIMYLIFFPKLLFVS